MKSGQALVLVMMVLSVALTVGLSIATRSTNEVKVTSSQEESARALEAAEAGLEKALGGTLEGVNEANLGGSLAKYVIATPAPVSEAKWLLPYQLIEGQVATVDLRNYVWPSSEKTKLSVCWGTDGSGLNTAVEMTLYYVKTDVTPNQIRLGRIVYDPSGLMPSTTYTGGMNNTSQCPTKMNFARSVGFDLNDFGTGTDNTKFNPLMIRAKFYGNGSNPEPLGFVTQNGGLFNQQGSGTTSVGSAGTSTQKVRGVELNYDLPMMFDNAVFSGGSLNKI